ncbi:MAG: hypothetical protein M3362_24005, partial [Acidobacteriota bacterium]|nr:hypothetical protein [Acidobacteriota bacterium]
MRGFILRIAVALLTFILGVTVASYWSLNRNDNASKVEQAKRNKPEEQNEKVKIVPDAYKGIDFKNFTYPYQFPHDGKKINATLRNGEYEFNFEDERGWLSFSEVYYADLTGDGSPEAIVLLWHVSCGGSCNGGSALFYVYTTQQNKLKSLWRCETGSLKYGCGLKSFSVKNKEVTLELFGRCPDGLEESAGTMAFLIKDTTRLTFRFIGRKFLEEKKEFISVPERDVKGSD